MSVKQSDGGGGKPAADDDTGRSTRQLLIVHGNRHRPHASREMVDGILRCIHEFYYIGDQRRSLRPIPVRSSWIATIWFQSDNRQFSSLLILYCRTDVV